MDQLSRIEDNLFFIVGCGRSGTTLLKTILNAHPNVTIPHETFFFNNIAKRLESSSSSLEDKLKLISSRWWIQAMGVTAQGLEESLESREPSPRNLFLALLKETSDQSKTLHYGEKTVAHIQSAEELLSEFPRCRVIQIIRDPRAAFASFKLAKVGTNQVAPLIFDWDRAMKVDEKLAGHERYSTVKFESLILNTEETIKQVCEQLRIPFDKQMLNFHSRSDKGFSAVQDHHKNTTKPIFATGLKKWKSVLSPSHKGLIELHLGEQMAARGYELVGDKVSFPAVRMKVSWFFHEIWKWCVGRPRAQLKKLRARRQNRKQVNLIK